MIALFLRTRARRIAAFHAAAPTSPEIAAAGRRDAVQAIWESSFDLLDRFQRTLRRGTGRRVHHHEHDALVFIRQKCRRQRLHAINQRGNQHTINNQTANGAARHVGRGRAIQIARPVKAAIEPAKAPEYVLLCGLGAFRNMPHSDGDRISATATDKVIADTIVTEN